MPASQTTLDPHISGPLAGTSGGTSPRAGTAAAPGPATQKPTTRRRPVSKGALRLVSPAIVLVIWQLASEFGLISTQRLPPPTQVWSTAVSLVTTNSSAYGTLQGAMLVSLERVAAGFAVGAVTAVLLALAAGLSRFGETAVDPLMQMLRTLPLFGLIPVFIVWFGIGQTPKILLIAIGTAIPLYLNTFAGIRSVDAKLAELGQVLKLRRRELITQIVLPGALPQILVGLRQSLGVAWLALVVAEQVNANAGLGFMISQATQFLRNDVIIVALLVYCGLGLLTDALVRLLERRALRWRQSFVAQ
ncbi:MAG TPA: ABC transporter permease [Streptosporangiaceae bacterium]